MKIGVCGTGDISIDFMNSAPDVENLEVKGVHHIYLERAQEFAKKYDIEIATNDYNYLLENVDCVYIGLPNSLHYSYAKEAIQKGRHVIVEKPITINHKQFTELKELADKHNVFLFEVSRAVYLPHVNEIKEKMNTEDNGKTLMHISFCKKSRRYDDYLNGESPNVFTLDFAGGALYDLGVYALHFVLWILGEPNESHYMPHILPSGVDGSGIITLKYDNVLVDISLSKISNGSSSLEIQGEKYSIFANSAVSMLLDYTILENDQETRINHQTYENMSLSIREITRIIESNDLDSYKKLLNHLDSVVRIMEKLRKDNNIIFNDDN